MSEIALLQLGGSLGRDWKVKEYIAFAYSDWKPSEPTLPAISSIYHYFRHNISRIKMMMLFPVQTALLGADILLWRSVAQHEIEGVVSNEPIGEPVSDAVSNRMAEISKRQMDEQIRLFADGDAWDQHVRERMMVGAEIVDHETTTAINNGGVYAMQSAYLVGTWTAFESMAADLWEVALNLHPDTLARLSGKPKLGKDREGDEVKNVSLDDLHQFNFDVQRQMGTLLRSKFNFDRLSGMRRAYTAAFSRNGATIITLLASPQLEALNIVRNLLVHKDGVVDDEYLRRAKSTNLPTFPKDKQIPLDGALVVSLMQPVMDIGAALLCAVETWLYQSSKEVEPI